MNSRSGGNTIFSGQAFSQRGLMVEIYDGSNADDGPYGITGFLGLPAAKRAV